MQFYTNLLFLQRFTHFRFNLTKSPFSIFTLLKLCTSGVVMVGVTLMVGVETILCRNAEIEFRTCMHTL